MPPRNLPPDVKALLEPLPADVRTVVERGRTLVLATLPKVVETADQRVRVIGYGYGEGYRDMVATAILSNKGVKLGLVGGAKFPDPNGLLAGSGKVHRYIPFTEPRQVGCPEVKAFLRLALAAWKDRVDTAARLS